MISPYTIADLHIHSPASDGTMTPAEIVAQLVEKDIGICSLTDHNSIANQDLFLKIAGENGLYAITGVEISSKIETMVYHILAYGFNPADKRVPRFVDPILSMMEETNRELIIRMSDDYTQINLDEYDSYVPYENSGGWKSVQYLYSKGFSDTPLDALSYYRKYNLHMSRCDYFSPSEVIEEIHSWGAFAILAHPNGYFRGFEPSASEIRDLFDQMKSYGIDGIEGYYPTHSQLMTETTAKWCKDNKMMLTVGCDSHGDFVPEREIGKIRIPLEKLNLGNLI
jgi:predicted metal-dependent phosphoesterase TrpH